MISSLKEAKEEICRSLREEHGYPMIIDYRNNYRYVRVIFHDGYSIFIVFKREHYKSFNRIQKGAGFGESINATDLVYCFNKKIQDIFFCYEDGKIYSITPQEIWESAEERITEAEGKKVFSFAMNGNLLRFNKEVTI